MLLELTSDQAFFRDTTARFLAELVPVGELRRLRDDPVGFGTDYWRRGADLGWTSLLVVGGPRRRQHERPRPGRPDARRPRVRSPCRARTADPDQRRRRRAERGRRERLVRGARRAADRVRRRHVVLRRTDPERRAWRTIALEVRHDGDDVVLRGVKRPVESAARADHLLVTGRWRCRSHPGARASAMPRAIIDRPHGHRRPHPPLRRRHLRRRPGAGDGDRRCGRRGRGPGRASAPARRRARQRPVGGRHAGGLRHDGRVGASTGTRSVGRWRRTRRSSTASPT